MGTDKIYQTYIVTDIKCKLFIIYHTMSDENEEGADETKKACSGLREELLTCLQKSDCFQKEGKTIKECMNSNESGVDMDCRQIQYSFFECRRSTLDMRTRFRGRKGY